MSSWNMYNPTKEMSQLTSTIKVIALCITFKDNFFGTSRKQNIIGGIPTNNDDGS